MEGKYDETKYEEKKSEEWISIKFVIQPEGFPHVVDATGWTTVEQLKEQLGQDLQLSPNSISFTGHELESANDLSHLSTENEYEVFLFIEKELAAAPYKLPSQIEVVVHYDDEDKPSQTLVVGIEVDARDKPYLGGYRHIQNGVVYHHASTQLYGDKQQEARPEQFEREAQTTIEISRSSQSYRENGTQMVRADIYIDSAKDTALSPRKYFDSESLHILKVEKSIVIQRYWRGSCARYVASTKRKDRLERQHKQLQLREKRIAEEKEAQEREIERRMNPRKAEDFEILYNELDNWRQHETTRIKLTPGYSESERRLELEELLEKETKLLQTIDKLKMQAKSKNREEKINKMLAMMACPKKWQMEDGDLTYVHTPFTTRAKELQELYYGLNTNGLSVDERLDILLHVKWTAKEFDCPLTRDLVDLIDREADLLNRGRSERAMQGLKKRICTLFLQFIETPEFNPEAANFQTISVEMVQK